MAAPKKDATRKLPAGVVLGRDVRVKQKEHIYHGLLQLGTTVLFGGISNAGKSTVVCEIAAELSKEGIASVLSLQEDTNDESRLRLLAAGADTDYVALTREAWWEFPKNLDALEDTIRAMDAKFAVLDTMDKHFEKGESSHGAQRILVALDQIAARTNCVIVLICHTLRGMKRNADPTQAFPKKAIGTARMGLLFGVCAEPTHPDAPHQRALVVAKAAHGPKGRVLLYDFDLDEVDDNGIVEVAPVLKLSDEDYDVSDWEAFAIELILGKPGTRGPDKTVTRDAADWLTDLLANGPVPVHTTIIEQGSRASAVLPVGPHDGIKDLYGGEGFSWSSVDRAKKESGIESFCVGSNGRNSTEATRHFWQLPDGHPKRVSGDYWDKDTKSYRPTTITPQPVKP